ncbi:MAG: type II secretion system protein [Vicinamibacterales bacterium]
MRALTARQRRRALGMKSEAGFTLIDMLFVVALVGLLASLAIPGLMKARGAAQSASALGTLRVANSAQLSFAITCGLGFYSPDFPTLAIVPPGSAEAFLPSELASGPTFVKGGYNFSMAGTPLAGAPATCNGLGPGSSAPGYAVVADHLGAVPNGRFFGTNADGIIYEHNVSLAGTMPESGGPLVGAPIK